MSEKSKQPDGSDMTELRDCGQDALRESARDGSAVLGRRLGIAGQSILEDLIGSEDDEALEEAQGRLDDLRREARLLGARIDPLDPDALETSILGPLGLEHERDEGAEHGLDASAEIDDEELQPTEVEIEEIPRLPPAPDDVDAPELEESEGSEEGSVLGLEVDR